MIQSQSPATHPPTWTPPLLSPYAWQRLSVGSIIEAATAAIFVATTSDAPSPKVPTRVCHSSYRARSQPYMHHSPLTESPSDWLAPPDPSNPHMF